MNESKAERQAVIVRLVEQEDIQTQEQLALALVARGFQATQATVSRDIKELRLVKILGQNAAYKYATPDAGEKKMTDRLSRIFADSVVSITHTGNIVVIKTLSGSANAAAEAVDMLQWKEVIGTIAGDNTMFIAINEQASIAAVEARFRELARLS